MCPRLSTKFYVEYCEDVAARSSSTSNHYGDGGLEYGFQSLRIESGEDLREQQCRMATTQH